MKRRRDAAERSVLGPQISVFFRRASRGCPISGAGVFFFFSLSLNNGIDFYFLDTV